MPWISAAVGIKDSADAFLNDVGKPFFLKLGAGLLGTYTPNGASVPTITITADGIALGAVDDIAALAIYPAASLDNGSVLGMASVRDRWELVWSSPSTPDGITVIAAAGVAGANWHRLCEPSTYWLFQSEWHINPSSGNDENGGASAGDSIATWAEMRRRVGNFAVSAIIYVYDDLPASDPARIPWAGPESYLLIAGVPTTLASGTIDAVTAISVAGQQALELTDAAITWATYLCKRVVFANGAVCWPIKSISANVARFTTPIIIDTSSPLATSFSAYTPTVGAAYTVQDVPTIDPVFDQPVSGNFADGNYSRVVFSALNMSEESVPYVPAHGFPQGVVFLGCDLGYTRGAFYAWSCMGGDALFRQSDYVYWYGGAFIANTGSITIYPGAFLELGLGTIIQTCAIDNQGTLSYTDSLGAAVFDSPGSAIVNQPTATIVGAATNAPLWGDSNATYGIRAYDGSRIYYDGNKPTITGATEDVRFGGADHPWADFPLTSAGLATIGPRQS